MSFQRELVEPYITDYLVGLIKSVSIDMAPKWINYSKNDDGSYKEYAVYSDLQKVLSYDPAVEVVFTNVTANIFSIGTQEYQYHYDIIITSAGNDTEQSPRYNQIIGTTIQDLFNDFSNRSFRIPNQASAAVCVYYSEASALDFGFRRGKGLYSNKITWMGKVLRPTRLPPLGSV